MLPSILQQSIIPSAMMGVLCQNRRSVNQPAGNTHCSCIETMTLETLTTVTLLMELLLALRANDPNGVRTLLEMGLNELGLDVVEEQTRDFLVLLLSEAEADRMVGWHLGVSL